MGHDQPMHNPLIIVQPDTRITATSHFIQSDPLALNLNANNSPFDDTSEKKTAKKLRKKFFDYTITCHITEKTESMPNFQLILNYLEIFSIFWSECQTKVADETESEKLIVPLLLYVGEQSN